METQDRIKPIWPKPLALLVADFQALRLSWESRNKMSFPYLSLNPSSASKRCCEDTPTPAFLDRALYYQRLARLLSHPGGEITLNGRLVERPPRVLS